MFFAKKWFWSLKFNARWTLDAEPMVRWTLYFELGLCDFGVENIILGVESIKIWLTIRMCSEERLRPTGSVHTKLFFEVSSPYGCNSSWKLGAKRPSEQLPYVRQSWVPNAPPNTLPMVRQSFMPNAPPNTLPMVRQIWEFELGLWTWTLNLEFGLGLWTWTLNLEFELEAAFMKVASCTLGQKILSFKKEFKRKCKRFFLVCFLEIWKSKARWTLNAKPMVRWTLHFELGLRTWTLNLDLELGLWTWSLNLDFELGRV